MEERKMRLLRQFFRKNIRKNKKIKKTKKSFENVLTKHPFMHIINIVGRRGVAQFGRVRGLGPWGRGFESLHPDQRKAVQFERLFCFLRNNSQLSQLWDEL